MTFAFFYFARCFKPYTIYHPCERIANMASTADRLRNLIGENLEVDGQPIDVPEDLNISLVEAGVPSTDLVAFAKLVSQEFNVTFTVEHCTQLKNMQEVVELIDSQ